MKKLQHFQNVTFYGKFSDFFSIFLQVKGKKSSANEVDVELSSN